MGVGRGRFASAVNQRANRHDVMQRVEKDLPKILSTLDQSELAVSVTISPTGNVDCEENILMTLIFSIFEPQKLGVIDYHGPHRNYNRERLAAVNLTIESSDQRSRQSALYNYNNKYA